MTESSRMYASISFVGVLIIIGVPLWWKTTEVYRVSLPYSRITTLDDIPFKIAMTIQLAFQDQERAVQMKNELNVKFVNSDVYDLSFELISFPSKFDASSESLERADKGPATLILIEWPALDEEVRVTLYRAVLFSKKATSTTLYRVLSEWLLSSSSLKAALGASGYSRHDAAARRRIPPARAFDVALTVAAPSPDKISVQWTPQEAIEEYIEPFVSELSAIHNFTLKSQWLYFVQLDFNPQQIRDDTPLQRHYALPEDVLPHLITPLEKKLASHISKNPCLNLVLYTPPCDQSPIHIYTKAGIRANGKVEAFLSPRWGGVVIGNPPTDICESYLNDEEQPIPVYRPPTKDIMGFFLTQLRLLLGIPDQDPISGAKIDAITSTSPRKWELDALIRIRTIEQVISAKLTLKSLAQLLGEISNIVINDEVGASIYNAVENVERTNELLKNGQLMDALECSRSAFLSAEAAFTDPSLLALLYFPDDQKYAVYMPLFLPIMIPVIMSMKHIWRWMQGLPPTKEKTD